MEFESINYKRLLAFNSNFTYFILINFGTVSMYSYLRIQHCALQSELQQPQCWSLTHVFLVVYGLRWYLLLEIIRIFNQGTVAQYCFWLAHCINVTLFDCCRLTLWMLLLQEIDEYETGLSRVDNNIRQHPFASSMVKRQEFDDQRELF